MTCVSPPGMKTYHTMNNDFSRTQLCGSRLSGGPHSMQEMIHKLSQERSDNTTVRHKIDLRLQ